MKRRNTKSKEQVLQIFRQENTALSHDMIQAKLESVERATIYRILNRFHEDGVLHKVTGEDNKQYFALCKNCEHGQHKHHHLHFQCLSCKTVECLENEITFSIPQGYQFQDFQALMTGTCSRCV